MRALPKPVNVEGLVETMARRDFRQGEHDVACYALAPIYRMTWELERTNWQRENPNRMLFFRPL